MNDYLILYLIIAVFMFFVEAVRDFIAVKARQKNNLNGVEIVVLIIINIGYGFFWPIALFFHFFINSGESK